MSEPLVIFSHGQESGPWGSKIRRLADVATARGFAVESIDYTDLKDPEARVKRLCERAPAATPLILAGSSMGGYVAARASATLEVTGLFLLAPAFGLERYNLPTPPLRAPKCTIVHGWDDEVVPVAPVIEQARAARAELHVVPDGHRLIDSLDLIADWFEQFLRRCR
ncbi:YqiA/YcfP family alpha/beta fold hydrolase [Marinobacteraceae bacterium S3BR75-40.1]